MTAITLNGRFLGQGLSGVQRFATEVARVALARWPETRLLTPPGTAPGDLAATPVGTRAGQRWEQLDLAAAARGSVLVNLGNTAPILRRGPQAVVIHDAGAFDTPESYRPAFRLWYRALHWALARNGTRLLTVSAFSRARLALRLGIAASRIGVVPEGHEHILRDPPDAGVLARHGLAPGGFALAVGTGAAHKGLPVLRAAAARLAAAGRVLAVAGAADPRVFAGAAGAAGLRALGRVSDAELRALYEAASCLVFPSRYEGFGLPPLEAMACGCPVVAAASGAVPEVCGDAALWAEGEAGFAAAIDRLLGEPSLPAELAARGRARAAGFTWDAAAAALRAQLP